MRANLETVHKKREFLSRIGILVLGVLPASMGVAPSTALGDGCSAEALAPGAGVTIIGGLVGTAIGGLVGGIYGFVIVGVGVAIFDEDYKECVLEKFEEVEKRFQTF